LAIDSIRVLLKKVRVKIASIAPPPLTKVVWKLVEEVSV
jgi:hypothetical protein